MSHVAPRTVTADHVSLEQGAGGFSQGVFIRVADASDGAVDTGREQTLRVADRETLDLPIARIDKRLAGDLAHRACPRASVPDRYPG